MTIEIRELVIEARVVHDTAVPNSGVLPAHSAVEEARMVEAIVRRVLALLDERRERL